MNDENTAVRIKRVYDPAAASDGLRALVDRLWPWELSKERVNLGYWAKDLAPSDALHRWYGYDLDKWGEFRACYRAELIVPPKRAALAELVAG